jgi:hypothetical protein
MSCCVYADRETTDCGTVVSYADFHVIAWMQCCRRVDEEVFASILSTDEAFGRLYQACEKWLARDD